MLKQCNSCGAVCRDEDFFCHECGSRDYRVLSEDEINDILDERSNETMAELDAMLEDLNKWEAETMAELDAMLEELENGEAENEKM